MHRGVESPRSVLAPQVPADAWRNASQLPAAPCPDKSTGEAALLEHGRIYAAYASKYGDLPQPSPEQGGTRHETWCATHHLGAKDWNTAGIYYQTLWVHW